MENNSLLVGIWKLVHEYFDLVTFKGLSVAGPNEQSDATFRWPFECQYLSEGGVENGVDRISAVHSMLPG